MVCGGPGVRGESTHGPVPESPSWWIDFLVQEEYTRPTTVDALFPSVRETKLERGPNWGLLIAFAMCIQFWVLVGIAVLELR